MCAKIIEDGKRSVTITFQVSSQGQSANWILELKV